jgi:cellulose biosynthesis protein BcsQ
MNLGVALASMGKKILLIDLDPKANLTLPIPLEYKILKILL